MRLAAFIRERRDDASARGTSRDCRRIDIKIDVTQSRSYGGKVGD